MELTGGDTDDMFVIESLIFSRPSCLSKKKMLYFAHCLPLDPSKYPSLSLESHNSGCSTWESGGK